MKIVTTYRPFCSGYDVENVITKLSAILASNPNLTISYHSETVTVIKPLIYTMHNDGFYISAAEQYLFAQFGDLIHNYYDISIYLID